ncbi:MAG: hypothetical protein JWL67_1783 [Solirubrobacterales bacterium]|nr:hypothetical protein [Solirubrobacterales bacterium]
MGAGRLTLPTFSKPQTERSSTRETTFRRRRTRPRLGRPALLLVTVGHRGRLRRRGCRLGLAEAGSERFTFVGHGRTRRLPSVVGLGREVLSVIDPEDQGAQNDNQRNHDQQDGRHRHLPFRLLEYMERRLPRLPRREGPRPGPRARRHSSLIAARPRRPTVPPGEPVPPARVGAGQRARGLGGPRTPVGRRGGRGSMPGWARP